MAAIQSMTGFAGAARTIGAARVVCEVRSVNGRSLDVKLRLPNGLEALDPALRKRVAAVLARGNVQLSIGVDRAGTASAATVDAALFRSLAETAKALAEETAIAPPTADGILAARGVVVADDGGAGLDAAAHGGAVLALADEVLGALAAARTGEGAAMAAAIAAHLGTIEALLDRAVADAASRPEAIRARLAEQIDRLLGGRDDGVFDAARFHAEAALLAVKADIREETDRLAAHVAAARDLLAAGGVIGRKLDFLAQEFNREVNTLCAKSASTTLTAIGLDMKSAVDQMREQVQNLQ